MGLNSKEADEILVNARNYIGTPYTDMDCSHFVWQVFKDSHKDYPYRNTATFDDLVKLGYFEKLDKLTVPLEADLLLFNTHIGIWDPKGCVALVSNAECKRLHDDAPFLSSRSSRGPDYGRPGWWGNVKAICRWKGIKALTKDSSQKENLLHTILNGYSAIKKETSERFNSTFLDIYKSISKKPGR